MFALKHYLHRMSSNSSYQNYLYGPSVELFSLLSASSAAVVVTFPIHKIVFRQTINQLSFQAAFRQLRIEGACYLYRGMLPMLINQSIATGSMYWVENTEILSENGSSRARFQDRRALPTAVVTTLVDGLCTPLKRVEVILEDGRFNNTYNSMMHVFRSLRPLGTRELYRGTSASLIHTFGTTYIFFALKDGVRDVLLPVPKKSSLKTNLIRNFIGGAFLGALLAVLMFPVKVTRVRMQNRAIGGRLVPLAEAWRGVWRDRTNTLKGLRANTVRAAIVWGSMSACDFWIDELLAKWKRKN